MKGFLNKETNQIDIASLIMCNVIAKLESTPYTHRDSAHVDINAITPNRGHFAYKPSDNDSQRRTMSTLGVNNMVDSGYADGHSDI